MTLLLCREDSYLLDFEAEVLERLTHEGQPALVLDRTAFYPEGGGQPWDVGSLTERGDAAPHPPEPPSNSRRLPEGAANNWAGPGAVAAGSAQNSRRSESVANSHCTSVPVVAVIEHEGRVLHLLAAPIEATRVRGQVDGARRRDHRQQHHGQHLLSRALLDDGARTIAFHLGAQDTTIDLDCWIEPAALAAAVRRANDIVWEGRPVAVRTVSREEATRAGCAVPLEAGERVRLVEAFGFDLQPCSGTHPARTCEVGVILVTGVERYKGGARVRFVCGDRALTACETRQSVLTGLSAQLSTPLLDLPQAVERTQQELEATRRRGQQLLERALEGDARRLLAEAQGTPAVVVQVLEGASLPELRSLAQRITALAPAVALLGTRGDSAQVVFARSPGLGVDIGALLKDALAALGGRGGGRGDLVQGGGPELGKLGLALAAAGAAARQALAQA